VFKVRGDPAGGWFPICPEITGGMCPIARERVVKRMRRMCLVGEFILTPKN
jgi:hypothetical protein